MQEIYGHNIHNIKFLSQDASHNIRLIFKWLDWNSLRGCSMNHDEQPLANNSCKIVTGHLTVQVKVI